MKLKALEHSLPQKLKKKMKSMKINNLNDLKKLTVTKKKFFVKILDQKDLKKKKKKKQQPQI